MRKIIIAVLSLALALPAVALTVLDLLTPSPLGMAIAGYSIMRDGKKMYYAKVEATGRDFEQARQNGFRLAVEKVIGPLILSESEVVNDQMRRDEIISYASGAVSEFNILSQTPVGNRTVVVMEVWVAESRIANRLLNKNAAVGSINGEQLSVRVETLLHERYQGDRVVDAVLRDFPNRAFDVETTEPVVRFTNTRTVSIDVPVTIKWNYDYLASLYEAMYRTSQKPVICWTSSWECRDRQNAQYFFDMHLKPPSNLIMGWNGSVAFDDPNKLIAIYRAIAQASASIKVVMLDVHGGVVAQSCQRIAISPEDAGYNKAKQYMINYGGNRVWINQRYTIGGNVGLGFAQDVNRIAKLDKVQVSVVSAADCQR